MTAVQRRAEYRGLSTARTVELSASVEMTGLWWAKTQIPFGNDNKSAIRRSDWPLQFAAALAPPHAEACEEWRTHGALQGYGGVGGGEEGFEAARDNQ